MTDALQPASPNNAFFRRIDWSSFWTATLISFAVYFLTAAPSVTLEDCGELVVAGDYLGVPHPPGYPIWTIFAWIFARLLSFVTFRGQPNPAWAMAVLSGFFGAIATGITAMLITRTSSDILRDIQGSKIAEADGADIVALNRQQDLLCWIGGVAGSLIFAFSPVMWSQSTIVEVYTLNALFLMWIFLLSYRWMRRPSDRILWLTAFVFGLGLTNYQVLLLAIVPLMIVIFLKDLGLFRDFILTGIPFVLTLGMLKLASLPSQWGFWKHAIHYKPMPLATGFRDFSRAEALLKKAAESSDPLLAHLRLPLIEPAWYFRIIIAVVVVIAACVWLALISRQPREQREDLTAPAILLALGVIALVIVISSVPSAPEPPRELLPPFPVEPLKPFSWAIPTAVFVIALAGLWIFAYAIPGGIWYAAAITAIQIAMAGLLVKGALPGLTHPATAQFWIYCLLNFVVLGLAWLLLPNGRSVTLTVLCAEAGVAFYAYMPVASDRNPPMNWGYARTWEGFKHAITRGQYEKISPTNAFSPLFIQQLGAYFSDLRMQFTLLLAPLGFLPFAAWQFRIRKYRIRPFEIGFGMAIAVAVLAVAGKIRPSLFTHIPRIDKLLIALILLLAAVGVIMVVLRQVSDLSETIAEPEKPLSNRITAGISLSLITLVVAVLTVGFSNAFAEFLLELYGIMEPPADVPEKIMLAYRMRSWSMTFVVVALVAGGTVLLGFFQKRRIGDLEMRLDNTAQQWLISTMAGFLMMSLFLVVLANPRGDLQDNFIQKVKFLSSHGLFAVWIGYGIVFGLAALVEKIRKIGGANLQWLVPAACLAALTTPLIPVYENYFNDNLVEIMSAANQDGHDFGWQFGNYQLRGAEAILEELDPDEEPPPNPDYPPPMTTNAVFFGGTDPGRFVPTYMIYSADVRPDVMLITQNALADNTYMNTMRDLYGDQIWMPMPKDNGEAFEQYVEDVRSGKRPNYGDISFEGGRVQVTGALAVMEINSILTEQIFKNNRDRHDFYVEESYTIRWMFPHLTPHGLIMKINRDQTPLRREAVATDMDFWDWYARRLLANPRYKRDLVARKSFSKLRGAIGGLYAARALPAQGERALREARALYPVSPEANLRLAQEILMPHGRMDEAYEMLSLLYKADPNNARLPEILKNVSQVREINNRTIMLQAKQRSTQGLTLDEVLELGYAYLKLGRQHAIPALLQPAIESGAMTPIHYIEAARIYQQIKKNAEASATLQRIPDIELVRAEFPSEILMMMASIHASAGQYDSVIKVLVRHLKRSPGDLEAWLDLATMNLRTGRNDQARAALNQALNLNRTRAQQLIQRSNDLNAFYNKVMGVRQQ